MRIPWVSIFVDDQSRALDFYTRVLGFEVKTDLPLGDDRWLTVVSPEDPDGVELLLEPAGHPAVGPFRAALAADGIPVNSFEVDDVDAEYRRLLGLGVHFPQPPTPMGDTNTAVFDDTCGNLIQIHRQHA
jgi:catechol 2,3-dioxygenase-like lactoylglutathione lyase family enzyme